MNKPAITCPISVNKVNENVTRVVAFYTIVVVSVAVIFQSSALLYLLTVDFLLRAFTNGKYSPVKYLARRSYAYLGLDEKLTDAAPKKFAAGIGIVFSAGIATLFLLHYTAAAYSVAALLLVCAGLESFKGYCVGCVVYTFLVLPFLPNANK